MIWLVNQFLPLRLTRALFLLFVPLSLAAGVLTVATTSAFGSDEATETIRLEPGDNYVGWVSDPISVDELFTAIPEAALIYAWDADRRVWHSAIPGAGGPLETMEPGMAAMIRIGGTRSVQWARPLTPAKGMVTLYRGVNWVSWLGRDEWPLDQVVRGIGRSLVSIRVGDDTWPAPLDDSLTDLPVLRRGDALEVTVHRDLRWLQPTGIRPDIKWQGNISQSQRETITADVQHVVDYFSEKLGVETDFADTTILIWADVESAVELQDSTDFQWFHLKGDALRTFLTHHSPAVGTPYGMHQGVSTWDGCNSRQHEGLCGVDILAHEWFHYLQLQIAARHSWTVSPEWMLEGTAEWGGNEGLRIADRVRSLDQSRADEREGAARTSVTLASAETRNTPWQYDLGLLAVDLLIERSGAEAPVEYFRQLHPQAVGPDRRWSRSPHWSEAFDNAFGISVNQFYAQFERWRGELPHTGPRYDYYQVDRTLHGSLDDANSDPAEGFWINAQPYIGENQSGRIRRTHVRDDGSFTIDLVPNTTQRLWLTRDHCTLWLTDDGLATTMPVAGGHRLLNTRYLQRLDLELPSDACSRANSIDVEVLPLWDDERRVEVGHRSDSSVVWGKQDRYGDNHLLSAPHPGRVQITVRVGGCDLWYASGALVAARENADWIELAERALLLRLRIPDDLCLHQITGRLLNDDGSPLSGVWLNAGGGGGFGGAHPDANGYFAITVPESGDYWLGLFHEGCVFFYGHSGAVTDGVSAEWIAVADMDVSGIEFRLPEDPASVCN